MITIRLQRRGRKNDPSYRVIVVDSHKKPKTGNYLEMVGSYDPRVDRVELKAERIQSWIKNGATTSGTVHNLLISNNIITGKKINVLPLKHAPKIEVAPTPVAPAVAEAATETEAPAESIEQVAEVEAPPTESAAAVDEEVATKKGEE